MATEPESIEWEKAERLKEKVGRGGCWEGGLVATSRVCRGGGAWAGGARVTHVQAQHLTVGKCYFGAEEQSNGLTYGKPWGYTFLPPGISLSGGVYLFHTWIILITRPPPTGLSALTLFTQIGGLAPTPLSLFLLAITTPFLTITYISASTCGRADTRILVSLKTSVHRGH